MSKDVKATIFVESASKHLEIPEARSWPGWKTWLGVAVILSAAAAYGSWKAGFRPDRLLLGTTVTLATLTVDEGELVASVTENGSLESANNAAVKCMVEALIGLTGGATGTTAKSGATTKSASSGSSGASSSTATSKSKATTGTSSASGSSGSGATSSGATTSTTGSTAATTTSTTTTDTTVSSKPTIRSFTYKVTPYVPLRPATSKAALSVQRQGGLQAGGGGGGGGGRGGGGGGGGGGRGATTTEKPGSTRVIKILDEGIKVKAGDVVCTLDSSDFETERDAQKIRYLQAKAWVEQAKSILEVNEISLREYEDGIYPQDVQLIKQYVTSCQIEEDQAVKNLEWSKGTAAKGFRTAAQLQADVLSVEETRYRLREAEGMAFRLEKFTGPRLKTNLRAKIEAIRSDKLSQDASFQLEVDRLRRLENAVANCTLRAPREGIVVYYNPPNMFGRSDNMMREGATVREGQTIIELPDPKHMRVRARINESKVSMIHSGQKALITVDAFPDRPMAGTVDQVTAIPSGAAGPFSDVKIYYATVNIDTGGFEDLRPGLSAEVSFLINIHEKVTRVPLQAIRWVDGKTFVAVATGRTDPSQGPPWEWREVVLGASDTVHFEVVAGLKPGDRVVAKPDQLPTPRLTRPASQGPAVAEAAARLSLALIVGGEPGRASAVSCAIDSGD